MNPKPPDYDDGDTRDAANRDLRAALDEMYAAGSARPTEDEIAQAAARLAGHDTNAPDRHVTDSNLTDDAAHLRAALDTLAAAVNDLQRNARGTGDTVDLDTVSELAHHVTLAAGAVSHAAEALANTNGGSVISADLLRR